MVFTQLPMYCFEGTAAACGSDFLINTPERRQFNQFTYLLTKLNSL